jgi:hypothetical protein
MKKIKLLITVGGILIASAGIAQNLHSATVKGVIEIGTNDIAIIYDEVTQETYKSAAYAEGLLLTDETINIDIETISKARVCKSGVGANIYCFKEDRELINPKKIAEQHNVYLTQMINAYLADPTKSRKDIFVASDFGLTDAQEADIVNTMEDVNVGQMKQTVFGSLNNNKAKVYLNQIDMVVNTANTYGELVDAIDDIALSINEDLVGGDWEKAMVIAEVSKASAEIWFSVEDGGSGVGTDFIAVFANGNGNGNGSDLNHVAPWVKKDGKGAGYASVTWAVGAALAGGPVAPITYAVAILGGALWGSFG